MSWPEIQESLLLVFAPVLVWWFIAIVAGAILSAIGAMVLETIAKITGQ